VKLRVIENSGRKHSAYGLFSSYPDQFAAILEDPAGTGCQFLVSRSGDSLALPQHTSHATASKFLSGWKQQLAGPPLPSPAIRCLIYAAYEAGALIEVMPTAKSSIPGPLLWTLYPDFSLCFDADNIHIAARDEDALQCALDMLDEQPKVHMQTASCLLVNTNVTSAAQYKQAVRRVKAYIAAGDLFQANIARFWQVRFEAFGLLALYDRLRRVNSAPFSACVDIVSEESPDDHLQLLSASPERLFRMHTDGRVDSRPIAGTRRRAKGDRDDSLRQELLLSEKERAEHIMLVDLERNDLGRVCQPGTVEVNECMVVEQYATVQHIVSNVRGMLQAGMDVVDLFMAMFPGGTITGCPKVRCMEVIHELEHNARGPYTGGLGYVAWDGSADMNILIRTIWHHQGTLHWAAGAGIVADSDPDHELIETEHKAEGLLRALST